MYLKLWNLLTFSVDSSYHQQLRGTCWSVFGALAACAEHTDVTVSSHTCLQLPTVCVSKC